ncbi:Myb/SANT-like DNA-binding domain-containing protein [Lactarius psammicola]|nr:Myb/SANT-like DNA-binding domain-containing protein [Lactarius psammicola]
MPKPKEEKNVTKWSCVDEATLVHTLAEQKTKGNWGDNNPKKSAWTACEIALAGSEKVSGGSAKAQPVIKSRWQRLKQEFDIVKKLRGLSGFGWDDAQQMVTASDEVWEDYLKVKEHHQHQKFQQKKFPLYDEIADLIDGTRATGANAFRAGQVSIYAKNLPTPTQSFDESAIDPLLWSSSDNVEKATDVTDRVPRKPTRKPGASFYDSDDASSEVEEFTPLPSKRKRSESESKSASNTMDEPPKVAKVMNPLPLPANTNTPSDDRRGDAIAYIEKKFQDELSDIDFAEAFELFVANQEFAKAFMGLKSDNLRMSVLRHKLMKINGK